MKKQIITVITIFMFILASCSIVQANSSATVTLKTSSSTVKAGEEFTVTMSVTCEDGINGIDTKYKYDTDKLEFVSDEIKDSKAMVNLSQGSGDSITIINNSESSTKNVDIVLTFKVKEGTKSGEKATITTEDILVDSNAETNSECTIKALSASITVSDKTSGEGDTSKGDGTNTDKTQNPEKDNEQKKDNSTEQKTNTGTEQQPNSGTTEKPSTTGTKTDETTTSTQKKTTGETNASGLPYTGTNGMALIVAGLAFISACIAIVAYKKYSKYKGI